MKKVYVFALISVFISLLFVVQGCKKQADGTNNGNPLSKDEVTAALTLLQNNCFSCHNPDMEIENRVAPPMFKIREHYLDDKITKVDFVNNIINFINNPTEENSIMPGAVRNFGLMPKQNFKEDDLKSIASYLYEYDVSTDQWYKEWTEFNSTKQKIEADLSYEDLGLKIANGTKSQLGKNLLEAIQKHGASGAVEFCNTRAIPITDSMSKIYHAEVKRVSDKPRNPLNQANEIELDVINKFKKNLLNNEKPNAQIIETSEAVVGYYPIVTNQMCLKCHGGKNKNILPETLTKINRLYPTDKAIGYGENELRGIFVVEMNKKVLP